jgi:hypothetical protein
MSKKHKNMSLIVVLVARSNMKTQKLVNICNLQKTAGETFASQMPVNDNDMHDQAAIVDSTYIDFKGVPPTATYEEVNTERNKAILMYNQNVAFIQGKARNIVLATGDINEGIDLVLRCGYRIKKVGSKPPRHFKASPGIECVDLSTKAVNDRAAYIRQYGETPTKGVPPTDIIDTIVSLETDIHVSNLESGKRYAFREASIIPVGRSSKSVSANKTIVKKGVTPSVSTKAHKAVFVNGAENYQWSDWIHVVAL